MLCCFPIRLPPGVKDQILINAGASVSATVCSAILRFEGNVRDLSRVKCSEWSSSSFTADLKVATKLSDIAKQSGLKLSDIIMRIVFRAIEDGSMLKNVACKEAKPAKPEHIDGSFIYIGVACTKNVQAIKFGITTDLVTRLETHKRSMSKLRGTFTPVVCIKTKSIIEARQCEAVLLRKFSSIKGINAFKRETASLSDLPSIVDYCRTFEVVRYPTNTT